MGKVAIYIRVAIQNQIQARKQRTRIERYIQAANKSNTPLGLVHRTYIDYGASGRSPCLTRKGIHGLLEDLRQGKVNTVIAIDLSRISRSLADFDSFLQCLEEIPARLILLNEQFDSQSLPKTAVGKLRPYAQQDAHAQRF